jgi:acetyl-CoA acetyltransferase
MSVQEIQAALEQMSPVELRKADRVLHARLKKAEANGDDCAYAMKEYGVTREELDAFVKRQNAKNREMDKKGLTVWFEGPFNQDWLD